MLKLNLDPIICPKKLVERPSKVRRDDLIFKKEILKKKIASFFIGQRFPSNQFRRIFLNLFRGDL